MITHPSDNPSNEASISGQPGSKLDQQPDHEPEPQFDQHLDPQFDKNDIFNDPSRLRLDQDFITGAGVTKVLQIGRRKPQKQEYVRTHPILRFEGAAILQLKDDNEYYFVAPHVAHELLDECFLATLVLTITKQGNCFMWPLRLPDPITGRLDSWNRSALVAEQQARTRWTRMISNKDLQLYDRMLGSKKLAAPMFPQLTIGECLRIAFAEYLIDSLDHPVVRRLRGEV
jgi:hypothetical protein